MPRRIVVLAGALALVLLTGIGAFVVWPREHSQPGKKPAATSGPTTTVTPTTSSSTAVSTTLVAQRSGTVPVSPAYFSDSAAARLAVSPRPPVQGQSATIVITPKAPYNDGGAAIDFGDGGAVVPERPPGYGAHCYGTAWSPQHVWRQSGAYHVVVYLYSCDANGYVSNDRPATATLDVHVASGRAASNGPGRPDGALPIANDDNDPYLVHVKVDAGDSDGYVTSISLDWGDGSSPRRFKRPLSACDDHGGTQYPSSMVDADMGAHKYATAGTYKLVATITSTGCDGMDQQAGTASYPIQVPCHIPGGCSVTS